MAKKIMIFDDDADLLTICTRILTDQHFGVVVRDTCSGVLQEVEAERPDVILMDNCIPGPGGVQATRLIKEDPRFASIPVIFCSASNDVQELAARAGAEFYLQKPFDMQELEDIIMLAVNKSPV